MHNALAGVKKLIRLIGYRLRRVWWYVSALTGLRIIVLS